MATPLSYRQWLQFKANGGTPEIASDAVYGGLLLNIAGNDGKLDGYAVGENRQFKGSDGQVYYTAGPSGNYASPGKGLMSVNDTMYSRYNNYRNSPDLINQVNAENQGYSTGNSYTTGGASAPQYQDTSVARAGTQNSLNELDTVFNNKLAQAQGEYDALIGQYAEEEGQNASKYQNNVNTNEGTREAQQQAALLAAANGGRGLYSTLASIGALGGTGKLLANRAVSNEANIDIGNANKTFDTNATNLFDTYETLKQQEKQRRLDAEGTLAKTKQAHEYDTLTARQQLMKDMAGLWKDNGNFAEHNKWLGDANALTGKIAATTRPNIPGYAKAGTLGYAAPELQSYLAGANDMTVNTSAGSSMPINGAIYTSTKKRDKL